MADAVVPRWHGDNYQARVFWENALNLLDPDTHVVEVSFEADGPKAFDDVVVRYDPPVARSGPQRVPAEFHQVKWHVEYGGRFGFEDLVDPAFIGAKTVSLLQRLQQARKTAPAGSRFTFLTTYRIKDGDPLAELVSGHDKSLLVEKLFDGTKTDKSRMGKARGLWREHLGLQDDAALREIVTGLRILEGHRSLEELRAQINLRAQVVGLLTFGDTQSDFRYDELARQLKVRGLNALTRESFLKLCQEEGLIAERRIEAHGSLSVAIRSFLGAAADVVGAADTNTLMLTDAFRNRYLRDGLDWQDDIRPRVEPFLQKAAKTSNHLRLVLDAHASIAFLAGSILDTKSGVEVDLVQKGRIGTRIWRVDDSPTGEQLPSFNINVHRVSDRPEVAIAIGLSQPVEPQVRAFVQQNLSGVGILLTCTLPDGPGHSNVAGGQHASRLAEQVSNALRELKSSSPDAITHIFAAGPNSLMFYLGQQHQGIAPCIVYEFDFDRRGNKTYQPSFVID